MFNPKVWTDCFKVSFKYLAVINFAKKALTSVIVTVVIIACPVKNRLIIILIFKIMMYGEIVGHIATLFTISIKKIHRIVIIRANIFLNIYLQEPYSFHGHRKSTQ